MSRKHVQDFLRELESVPEQDRGGFVTNCYLESLSNDLRIAVIRMAKREYFNLEILLNDCPEFTDSIESIYEQLQELSIVEEFPRYGFNVHELTRSHINGGL